MRDFKGMKRQRGRNRGGGGGSGGGGKPQQNANRAFDSNGPEGVKVRGNAQHVFEKYQQLARDAGSAGDRVLAENYLQHAEHYFRLLRAMQPQRPASEILGRDTFSSGYDIDFEDEGVQAQALAADEAAAEGGERAERESQDGERRDDRPRDDRPRDRDRYEGRQRDDRARDDRQRDDRPRDDRQRDDRPRGERDDRPRDERPREEREGGGRRDRWRDRDDRNRSDRPRGERDDRPRDERRDPLAVVEPQAQAPLAQAPLGEDRPAERPAAVLRDAEGGESHAPAFLQARAEPKPEAAADEEGARKPRRRRAPRTFEAGEGAPTNESEEA
ncbi:DUF4167 domain-containing protein [Phenylobacterium sp. J367]|uniref:DUF4167 domain-containing protein n=1 Tax=Phenylobacterium sp. J367 TaxID=2898435 RepID=UPI002150CA2A|nr:DUF4167 domain-containing protein [Phenylobacterium sp. J367]MCR5878971.1 DUF4167 domain-containing protein [Phenylobacterium sp. J367]